MTRRVDGLVIMPASDRQDYLAAELRTGTPVVFVDRPPRGVDADSVTIDNALGARLAASHLLAQGHRRVAGLFHLARITTAQDRIAGYRAAHDAMGLEPDPRLVVTDLSTADEATAAVLGLLDLAGPADRDLRRAQHPGRRGGRRPWPRAGCAGPSPSWASTTSRSPTCSTRRSPSSARTSVASGGR